MSLVLQSSGGGSVTVQEPTTASNFTATLPASDGTVMVSGNMPAFSAYQSTLQSLAASTFTKLDFQTEEFDTNNNFASSRFTPTVAGYYQLNGGVGASASGGILVCNFYKNGTTYKSGSFIPNNALGSVATASIIVYLNGSTDYVELYGYQSSASSSNTIANGTFTYFNGSMVRGA
jgi:hypothetical protein